MGTLASSQGQGGRPSTLCKKPMPMAKETQDTTNNAFVGMAIDFIAKRATVVTVQDREIVIFHRNGNYYALDRQCYHGGGPLQEGDIEDIQGHPCVICPWHHYIICLDTGEGLYQLHQFDLQSVDPAKPKNRKWKSKGLRQRTHLVTEGADGGLYVRLSDLSEPLPSDHYHSPEYKQQTWVVPQQCTKPATT